MAQNSCRKGYGSCIYKHVEKEINKGKTEFYFFSCRQLLCRVEKKCGNWEAPSQEMMVFGGKFCLFVHKNTLYIVEILTSFLGNKHFSSPVAVYTYNNIIIKRCL